jgi:tripartite-type tricarboxylate transporter receptor subunit TctC
MAAAPDIPTVDEAGLPGLYFSNWKALWAPARTPKDVIARLNGAAVAALADKTVRARLADLGQEIYPRDQQTPEALAVYQNGRNREVVAHHQGREYQGGVSAGHSIISRSANPVLSETANTQGK